MSKFDTFYESCISSLFPYNIIRTTDEHVVVSLKDVLTEEANI